MSHLTHKWVMSHMKVECKSCHLHSHTNKSCHTWMSHAAHAWECVRVWVYVVFELWMDVMQARWQGVCVCVCECECMYTHTHTPCHLACMTSIHNSNTTYTHTRTHSLCKYPSTAIVEPLCKRHPTFFEKKRILSLICSETIFIYHESKQH